VKFTPLDLDGAFLVDLEPIEDARGFFARSWCEQEFRSQGLNPRLVQCNISFNKRRGTLRGLHLQRAPHQEAKLVRCTMGAIYDVIVDVRPESRTYGQWRSAELSAHNRAMLYLPEGFAHGFQTLTEDAEVFYQMSESYHPDAAAGYRWDDPAFAIAWPVADPTISESDLNFDPFPR
jgi:dTDP-4-dehydrorhamnose 3,5-epimerase